MVPGNGNSSDDSELCTRLAHPDPPPDNGPGTELTFDSNDIQQQLMNPSQQAPRRHIDPHHPHPHSTIPRTRPRITLVSRFTEAGPIGSRRSGGHRMRDPTVGEGAREGVVRHLPVREVTQGEHRMVRGRDKP